MFTAALICLEVFAAVAMIDGLYFHLMKYRLFARPDSQYEHRLHTLHALMFPILVLFLFLRDVSGQFLWIVVGLVAIDFGVEMLDVVCERASRAAIGGLSSSEYAVHVVAITSRVAAFTLALASRPAAAWTISGGSIHVRAISTIADVVCWSIAAGGMAMAVVHLWLMFRPAGANAQANATSGISG
jgi:hypothetical protein